MKLSTLCYIERDNKYLMLHRIVKKNDLNKDKWIGVGGHFEQNESPEECLLREVKEETGLELTSYYFRGIVTFVSNEWDTEYMSLFTADDYTGDIISCDEGVLEWVDKKELLNLNLWEGDKIFLKLLEENHPFFSLKLMYEGNKLVEACLDGKNMELFDIRTLDGEITGKVRERSLVHRDGDIHGTAHVWIIRKNNQESFEILLQKRSDKKDAFPGCYDISSAGHVMAGDDFLETALRELEEELGIRATTEDLTYIGMNEEKWIAEFYGKPFYNHELAAVYVYQEPVLLKDLHLQQEEVESVMWMEYEECINCINAGTLKHCLSKKELEMLRNFIYCRPKND